MFSQKLIWSGKICYTNIVVSSLIMRSDDVLLKKRCISLRFYLVTFFIIILLLWDKPSDKLSPNSITISVQMSLFFNGLWPFVIKVTSGLREALKRCVVDECTCIYHHSKIKKKQSLLQVSLFKMWPLMRKCDRQICKEMMLNWNILQTFENVSQMLPNDFRMVFNIFRFHWITNASKCIGNAVKCIPMFQNASGSTLFLIKPGFLK